MTTFTSPPSTIEVRHFVSDPAEVSIRRFESEGGLWSGTFQIPGGCLVWTVRKGNSDSVHAARVNGSIYGAVPPFHTWDDTQVNQDDGNSIEPSDSMVSPFYTSPSVHMDEARQPVFSAVSEGLTLFSVQGGTFETIPHPVSSRHAPVRARLGIHPDGGTSAGYLLDSGNLYHEDGGS